MVALSFCHKLFVLNERYTWRRRFLRVSIPKYNFCESFRCISLNYLYLGGFSKNSYFLPKGKNLITSCSTTSQVDTFLKDFTRSVSFISYARGDSMNGTPTVSWQRLCAINRVKLKVTKSSVKS